MAGEKDRSPPIQIHIEPEGSVELADLTAALAAYGRQYSFFARDAGLTTKASDARIFVSSVSPGSIDIGFELADIWTNARESAAIAATWLSALSGQVDVATKFLERLNALLEFFRKPDADPNAVTVQDCLDAVAIAAPIANSGGTQTINIHNGDIYNQILVMDVDDAREITKNAYDMKALKQYPDAERRQNVALVWYSLDGAEARGDGKRNPDKGIIEELDSRPRSVFFDDDLAYLKQEMLAGVPNPFQKIYFVDVEVSRVDGKVGSYRVTAYHGNDDR